MTFTQLIEVDGADEHALLDHVTTWHGDQHGTAPGYRGARVLADRDHPGRHVVAVDFASEEEAERNNHRLETARWAERLRELGTVAHDGYRNLREVGRTY